jgi:spore germination protein
VNQTKLAREFSAWITEEHECWDDGLRSVEGNADKLDYVMPCLLSYTADDDLKICETERTPAFLSLCREKGLPMMPLIAADPKVVSDMIDDPARRRAHIAALLDYVCDRQFIGVDVDYEFLPEEMKDGYTAFIGELAAEFDKAGKLVSIDLHPKVRPDDPWSIGARAQDWKALATRAHILRVMCYDQYCVAYKYADAGPVSTLPWSEAVMSYAVSVIPLDKLIMGIPFYGAEYDTVDRTGSRWIFYGEAMRLKNKYGAEEKWHSLWGVSHFDFVDESGHKHEVWYENGRSVKGKSAIAAKYGVRGISCWAIADEDPMVWPAVAEGLGAGE